MILTISNFLNLIDFIVQIKYYISNRVHIAMLFKIILIFFV